VGYSLLLTEVPDQSQQRQNNPGRIIILAVTVLWLLFLSRSPALFIKLGSAPDRSNARAHSSLDECTTRDKYHLITQASKHTKGPYKEKEELGELVSVILNTSQVRSKLPFRGSERDPDLLRCAATIRGV